MSQRTGRMSGLRQAIVLGNDLIQPKILCAIIEGFGFKAQLESENQLKLTDGGVNWGIKPEPGGCGIEFSVIWQFTQESPDAARLKLVNHINGHFKMIRASIHNTCQPSETASLLVIVLQRYNRGQ